VLKTIQLNANNEGPLDALGEDLYGAANAWYLLAFVLAVDMYRFESDSSRLTYNFKAWQDMYCRLAEPCRQHRRYAAQAKTLFLTGEEVGTLPGGFAEGSGQS
jgi:hypothetical protein